MEADKQMGEGQVTCENGEVSAAIADSPKFPGSRHWVH